MKKIVITLGAMLVFGTVSSQTDTTKTKTDRDRIKIEQERNEALHTTKTPEARKDNAKTVEPKVKVRDNIPTPPPIPSKPTVPKKTEEPITTPPLGISQKE